MRWACVDGLCGLCGWALAALPCITLALASERLNGPSYDQTLLSRVCDGSDCNNCASVAFLAEPAPQLPTCLCQTTLPPCLQAPKVKFFSSTTHQPSTSPSPLASALARQRATGVTGKWWRLIALCRRLDSSSEHAGVLCLTRLVAVVLRVVRPPDTSFLRIQSQFWSSRSSTACFSEPYTAREHECNANAVQAQQQSPARKRVPCESAQGRNLQIASLITNKLNQASHSSPSGGYNIARKVDESDTPQNSHPTAIQRQQLPMSMWRQKRIHRAIPMSSTRFARVSGR